MPQPVVEQGNQIGLLPQTGLMQGLHGCGELLQPVQQHRGPASGPLGWRQLLPSLGLLPGADRVLTAEGSQHRGLATATAISISISTAAANANAAGPHARLGPELALQAQQPFQRAAVSAEPNLVFQAAAPLGIQQRWILNPQFFQQLAVLIV